MSLRARLAAWIDRTFWPGLDEPRQPCPSVAEVVARMAPPAPQPRPPMPGLYGSLDAEMLRAGPRRVTLAPAEPAWSRRPYRIHDEPPPHVPPLPADKPDESRPDVERAARDFLSAVSRLPNPTQKD